MQDESQQSIVWFDGEWVDFTEVKLSLYDRGFLYGDGFFETMRVLDGRVRFLNDHIMRIRQGSKVLALQPATDYSAEQLTVIVQELIKRNHRTDGRLKWIIWRKQGGSYAPETQSAHMLMMLTGGKTDDFGVTENAGIAKDTLKPTGPMSPFKSLSSSIYVMASIEMQQRKLDDIILCNQEGFVCEASHSNIFWYRNDRLITPALSSGCIHGVMRKNIIKYLNQGRLPVEEVLVKPKKLNTANALFTTNASGLRFINSLDGITYPAEVRREIISLLTPLLQP